MLVKYVVPSNTGHTVAVLPSFFSWNAVEVAVTPPCRGGTGWSVGFAALSVPTLMSNSWKPPGLVIRE